jgi:hypothetical protein
MAARRRNGGRFAAPRLGDSARAENFRRGDLRKNVSRETSAQLGATGRRLTILKNNPMDQKIDQ